MIVCSNKHHFKYYPYKESNWCVYFLHFGDAIYIGATNKLVRRIQVHICAINSALSGKNKSNNPNSLNIGRTSTLEKYHVSNLKY